MPNRQRTVVIAALAAVVLAAGGGVYWWQSTRVPPPTKGSIAVQTAAQTKDYASVRKAVESGQLSRDEVRVAVRQEFERQTLQRLDDYFTSTDAKTKQAVLDRAIDDLERFRAESRKAAAARAAANKDAKPAGVAESVRAAMPSGNDPRLAMAAWALRQPPATRARLAEFRVAIEKRRSERGLPGLFDGGQTVPLGGNTPRTTRRI